MKADQFGTYTEQVLFRMGFQTAKERPKCAVCEHSEIDFADPGSVYEREFFRCKKANCVVQKTSICNEWESMK
jgi:hypothetical protein